jgi:hypothetical protein
MIAIIRIEEPGLTQQGAHQAAIQEGVVRGIRLTGRSEPAAPHLQTASRNLRRWRRRSGYRCPVPNGRATMDVRLQGGAVTKTR